MQRIIIGRSATLTHTFNSDGDPADPSPDDAIVTITRDDGTPLVTEDLAVDEGAGVVSYTLTPEQTGIYDRLRFDWQAVFGGEVQTFTDIVEVCGGYLFSIADARRLKPLNNANTYSVQQIIDARTLAETALEDACAVSFVPRYFTQRLDGRGRTDLLLSVARPLEITSATVDGAAAADVSDIELYDTGNIYRPSGWGRGRRNVVITGACGYKFPPPRVGRAALLLAKQFLVDSPVSDRATSMTTEDGTTQFLVTAGVRQAMTNLPECNAVIDIYGLRDASCVA